MGGEGGELPILGEIDFKIVLEGGREWGPLKGGDAKLTIFFESHFRCPKHVNARRAEGSTS